MNVVIRADGSDNLGNGHIYRTLRLADELYNCGHNVSYICEDLDGAPFDKIEKKYSLKKIKSDEDGVQKTLEWAQTKKAKWIIVDRYATEKDELEAMKDLGYKVLAIDDICKTEFPVDILVNHQLWAEDFNYTTLEDTIKLFGPEYALIDDKYFGNTFYTISAPLKVFVFMGGADIEDYTYKIIHSLLGLMFPCKITVVLGSTYKFEEKLQNEIKHSSKIFHNVVVYKDIDGLFEVAQGSHLAIISGGTAMLEMCAMEIPMLIFPYTENQKLSAAYAEKYGVGFSYDMDEWEGHLLQLINDALCNSGRLLHMHKNTRNIIQESGMKKIVKIMEKESEEENE